MGVNLQDLASWMPMLINKARMARFVLLFLISVSELVHFYSLLSMKPLLHGMVGAIGGKYVS